jgi:hypothetical protein
MIDLSIYDLRNIYNGLELPSAEAIQAMREEINERCPSAPFQDDPKTLAETLLKLRGAWQA